MSYGRTTMLAVLAALGVAACSKKSGPAPPAADSAASYPAPAHVDGSPQLANSADGVHIEYHVYGRGEPAVVLVHGWSCDANYWNAQLDALKAKYTVVTVDLAGHGASEKNRTDWSLANYGEDVAAVVRQIPNHQVVIVGHSMGAVVALEATRRIGDRVIGIIAVDALKSIGLPPMPPREVEMRIAPFRANFIGQTRKFVTENFFTRDADPVFIQKIAYDMSLEPAEVAVLSMQSLLRMDFASVLPDIHVPVLAINSDRVPTDEARIRKSLPDFKADVLENTGHFLMMEAPKRFNPLLLQDIDLLVHKAHH
jgi:pimeloyl-ACP methyl ester carboxylesterase